MIYKNAAHMRNFLGLFVFIVVYFSIFWGHFDQAIIPLALVGYEMIIANSAVRALWPIYHLISNACSWNNC